MNFEILTQDYLKKLEAYIKKCDNISALIDEVRSELSIMDRKKLTTCEEENRNTVFELRKFYEKIKLREFKIAVVGLEGSGKSTFINSLVNHDFLPTKHDERCTLASVELKQSETDKHHVTVTYKTQEELHNYTLELESLIKNPTEEVKISGTNSLVKEKEELQANYDEIFSLIAETNGKSYEEEFETLDMLKDSIKEYITNSVHARAVKTISISTKNLNLASENKEFILYDVPGYDSPLKFHKDQTQKQLSDADLIIFIHSISERADLKEGQVVMMTISDGINKSIRTKDKLFVFLNKIDKINTPSILQEKVLVAKRDWSQYCRTESNLFIGSAQAYLSEINAIDDSSESIEGLEKLGSKNGINEIKSAINNYLETERFNLIAMAIKALFRKGDSMTQKLMSILESNGFTGQDESILGDRETIEIFKEINIWWDAEKETIEDEFEKWYFNNILRKEIADELSFEEHPQILDIKKEHLNKIDSIIWDIEQSQVEKQILRDMSQEIPQINASNINIRKEHYEVCMRQVDEISHTLSVNLSTVANDVISWIYNRLYQIETVDKYFYTTFKLETYAPSMSALYIRHARPLVDVFIKAAHGTNDRKNIANARKSEINSLKIVLEINLSFNLIKIISQIFEFLGLMNVDSKKHEVSIPIEINVDSEIQSIDFLNKSASSEKELLQELNIDTKLLVELLKDTAFESSGIMEYCYQELDKIRRFFKSRLHSTQLRNLIIDNMDNIPELYSLREKVRKTNHKKRIVAEIMNKLTIN